MAIKSVIPIAFTATQADINTGLANNLPKGTAIIVVDANSQPIDIKVAQGGGAPPADSSGIKNNLAAITAPTVTDDSGDGYTVGSRWIDTVADESYICVDAALNNALWSKTTVGTIAEVANLQTTLDGKSATTHNHTGTYEPSNSNIQSHVTAAHAPSTAEQNVNPDWNAVSGDGQILNKPTVPALSSTTPVMDGIAAVGTGTTSARTDHVHPSDTSREVAANKNVANGYAGLDANSKIAIAQLPSLATTTTTSLAPILGANIGFPGYRRSKLIPITSTTTGSGDYQIELAIGESALSVGATFHLAGNSQDFPTAHKDSGEFAFVKPDGTQIPFWVAEVTGTAPNRTARIYLRMPGLTGQATTVQSLVFMLYDNNLMTIPSQMSVITSVFNLLADDWDGASLDLAKWVFTGPGASPTQTGSILTFDTANTAKIVDSIATFGDGMEILHRTTFVTDSQSTSRSGFIGATTTNDFAFGDVWNSQKSLWVGATQSGLATEPDATSRLYRLSRLAGNGSFRFTNTDTVIEATRTSVPTGATPVRPWNAYGNTRGDSDWIAVRQVLAVPPTLGTVVDV